MLEGEYAHHQSGPPHDIASMRVWMFVSCMELVACANEFFVQVGFRKLHLNMLLPSCTCLTLTHPPRPLHPHLPHPLHMQTLPLHCTSTCTPRKGFHMCHPQMVNDT
ncbi:hypothetical protein O181_048819 [Austropuccinia psidii MF-1]|uniref:Uncharacterized protein n=1 Tax=Austropuccinia psidii MF-1 TaxID=1389203 RepID=A0A9Q3DTL2_9BASI|nr:hypothetical protein [Austropuccinia psidii MF-1]